MSFFSWLFRRTSSLRTSTEAESPQQPTEEQLHAAADIESALREQSGAMAEAAVFRTFSSGPHPIHAPSLSRLIEAPWHSRHEDIARLLQQLRSPGAVDALERTAHARHPYLDYDDGFALARKCTWALADIGTPEAHQALTRLANGDNTIIAGWAQKRITNWDSELDRKGPPVHGKSSSEGSDL